MTEHKEKKDVDANDPRNQAAAQTGNPDAKPGEPGYYNPPSLETIHKSPPNEVPPPDLRPKIAPQQPAQPVHLHDTPATGAAHADEDYESKTVPELKELAAQRGIEIQSDDRKDDIIAALKKG